MNYSQEELSEICEDAFINIKEACIRLQEKTQCSNAVVVSMLNNLIEFYQSLDQKFEVNEESDSSAN